jgi:putative transposase
LFLRFLKEAADARGLAVHAYVLMANHVHILATGSRAESLSRTIQDVGRTYVPYFNKRHGRTGALWEGRYYSTLVDTDEYLLTCHRYVELNPTRAGLVQRPADYRWSSHRFHAHGIRDELVQPHSVLLQMAATEDGRRDAYQRLFGNPVEQEFLDRIRQCSRRGWALGSERFCRSIQAATGRAVTAPPRGWRKGRPRNTADKSE